MSYAGNSFTINDFSGGLNSNSAVTELDLNEALDESNVIVGPSGSFFRTRYGDTEFNASAMNSGANVQGLGYAKFTSADDFLVAVCGNMLFRSATGLGGTMSDISGVLTITAGQNNIWTQFTFNDVHLGFGGPATNPDAPWSWTGSGNAAVLGGSPPSAYGAFHANNRVFAFRTAANPSRILWSILGNQADWTGTGSGNADIWTSDNDSLTAAAVMDNSTVLLFKENSIHKMIISQLVSSAFPIYPIVKGSGCVGKHACVVADGLCYFITSQGRMKITDGERIYDDKDYPNLASMDDLWSATNSSRWQYTQGMRVVGADYDQIWWAVSSSSSQTTNNWKFIWDLKNRCWLRDKTGYAVNVATTTQAGIPYGGHTNGKIYKKDVSTATTDASNSSTQIDSYWTSGWIKENSLEKIKQPRKANLSFVSQSSGNIQFSWGFDFNSATQTTSIDQRVNAGVWGQGMWGSMVWGGATDLIRPIRITGRGNVFQYRIRNIDSKMKINSLEFSGKVYGQKELAAR